MSEKANYKRIEKGSVIGREMFYVVVSTHVHSDKLFLYCLCDNANNIYSFEINEILNEDWLVFSPKTAMGIYSYGHSGDLTEKDYDMFYKMDRPIPADVIAEVLSGQEDHRFDHWYND